MGTLKNLFGKFLYGSIFMLVLPGCLYLWAMAAESYILLPVPDMPVVGILLIIAGTIICLWGMISLMLYGKGLPMNAYPPKYYVYKGIYAVMHHPIYAGSGMIAFGLSLFNRSSSGFWLVSPLFCIAMIVFVTGYENEKIKKAGGYFNNKTFFSLPAANSGNPLWVYRVKVFILAFVPWIVLYELFIFIGVPKDALFTNLAFEKQLPVMEWTEIFYVLPYALVIVIPFILNTTLQLRNFIKDVWWAMLFAFIIYMSFPFVVWQREFIPNNFLGEFIYWERSYDGVAAALPAFHVIWAFICAKYFSIRFKLKWFWWLLALLISLSCIANGNHSVPDVLTGFFVFILVQYRIEGWNNIRRIAESIAGSWREWQWGNVRFINHGMYAGLAALAGMFIVSCCLEGGDAYAGLIIAIVAIAGAALWAQIVEGSPGLLRPYGYYGGVLGILAGIGIITLFYDIGFMYLLTAFAFAGPWIQLLGRLRCLVQGCCHGKPCKESLGIRFTNPHSRVLKMAALKGIPIYPTQLYSIGSNLLIGLLLIRFVSLEMPVSFVTGMYFILNGLARFVEEGLRGEPQTIYWMGLRLYQWLAIISIVGGAAITCIRSSEILGVHFNSDAIIVAAIAAVISTMAYGMDFPGSNKRFARLTG
jgi:protein-S-isoprenylcysteine O-methyltransferase Ste14